MKYLPYFLIGFVIWFLATMLFRFAGHHFFNPSNLAMMMVSFFLVIPVVIAIVMLVFARFHLNRAESFIAASCMALPGMFLDSFALLLFPQVFPNLAIEADGYYGSWLLLAYASVLIAPLFYKSTQD